MDVIQSFKGVPKSTIVLPATTTSVNTAFAVPQGGDVRVVNNGSSDCRVSWGTDNTAAVTSPVAGTLTGSTYTGGTKGSKVIKAGSVEVLTPPDGSTYVAVKCDSGTTTMEFTPGVGA